MLVENARSVICNILLELSKQVFQMYPPLINKVHAIINHFLESRQYVLLERLEEMLLQEEDVFTINSYYLDTTNKLKTAIQTEMAKANGKQLPPNSNITVGINDLKVTFDLASLTTALPPTSSPHYNTVASTSGAVLDMQINCFSYMAVAHKRLCDHIPLLIRFHLMNSLTHTQSPSPNALAQLSLVSLYQQLQQEFIETVNDKQLLEMMKEERETGLKRARLQNSIQNLEKACQLLDNL